MKAQSRRPQWNQHVRVNVSFHECSKIITPVYEWYNYLDNVIVCFSQLLDQIRFIQICLFEAKQSSKLYISPWQLSYIVRKGSLDLSYICCWNFWNWWHWRVADFTFLLVSPTIHSHTHTHTHRGGPDVHVLMVGPGGNPHTHTSRQSEDGSEASLALVLLLYSFILQLDPRTLTWLWTSLSSCPTRLSCRRPRFANQLRPNYAQLALRLLSTETVEGQKYQRWLTLIWMTSWPP